MTTMTLSKPSRPGAPLAHLENNPEGRYLYCSIDLETTAIDPDRGVILQFGAILDDLTSPLEDLPKLEYLILQEDGLYPGESGALAMNAGLIEEIAKIEKELQNDDPPVGENWCFNQDLVWNFHNWLTMNNCHGELPKITFAGKNFAGFDQRWIEKHLFDDIGWPFFSIIPTLHRSLDVGFYFWRPWEDGPTVPNLKTCMERAGVFGDVEHRALSDAMNVVRCIRSTFE